MTKTLRFCKDPFATIDSYDSAIVVKVCDQKYFFLSLNLKKQISPLFFSKFAFFTILYLVADGQDLSQHFESQI